MFSSIKEESEDHTGICQRFIYPAFAPEADIVTTGAFVLATL